jgi:thiamine pyrophosphokinase
LTEDRKATLLDQGVDFHASPPEKDETDLELALLYAADHGATEIVIIGAFGGRVDMSVANLLLMTHPKLAGIHIEMWFGSQTAWIIRPPGDQVQGQVGDTLSLIPLIGEAEGVTTQNLAYPLNKEQLAAGPSRGLSNVFTDTTATIMLGEGILLAVHTPGHA